MIRITTAAAIAFCLSGVTAHADTGSLTLSKPVLTAKTDLGEATFTYRLHSVHGSGSVGMQLYVHRDDVTARQQWDTVTPLNADGSPVIVKLTEGEDTTGKFTVPMKRGDYGKYRLILFRSDDGKSVNFSKLVYDSEKENVAPLALSVRTETRRVKSPTFYLPDRVREITEQPDGNFTVVIPASIKVPNGYQTNEKGFWAMAKSSAGFSQVWAAFDSALDGGDIVDNYRVLPVRFEIKDVKPGLWNVQFGLFKQNFGDPLQWAYPGLDFEAGGNSWEKKADDSVVPPRLRVHGGKFVTAAGKPYAFYAGHPDAMKAVGFVRGGNYGNAIFREVTPALNTPEFFTHLKEMGCRYMRINFNQNRYPAEELYRDVVDQAVQNIWAAGIYPIICPQGLPDANTLDQQADKGLKVVQAMAAKYRGKSVWLEICNEPHEFGTWEAWKPIAERYVKAIRAIDPEAFVIVPLEGYSKDGKAAAKDPITDVAVDLYDAHAYVEPDQFAALYGPAIKAGLPLLIGEYGGGADYLRKVDLALQKMPAGVMGVSPWAFTIAGQDSLPLIKDGTGDTLTYTAAGQVIANDYAAWNNGHRRGEGTD